MNSGCRGGGGKQSLANSGVPCSFHPLKESQPEELQNVEEKSVRIKRRRTRRERNYVKFGRNGTTDRVPDQRPSYKGHQKMLPPFWGSQLSNCIKQSGPIQTTKGTCCNVKPVIITQNRLSQHLGMFNREVKSADIERLLSPRTEQQVVEVTPLQRDSGPEKQMGEELHRRKSCAAEQKCIPSELLGSSVKDLGEDNEDSFPTVVHAVPAAMTEDHSVATVCVSDAGSQPLVGPSAVEFGQQTLETEMFESNTMILNEKENVPPVATVGGAESGRGKSPVRQLAQDLEKHLDLKAIFPGRNLISETRQAVIDALRDQKKTLPDLSALLLLKRLAGGCNRGTTPAAFKSPADRDQGLELKSVCSSSRHSDQGVSLKKRKGREPLFLTSPTLAPSPAIRMAEERSSQREDLESFVEPEVFDQHSFYWAALQPLAHLLPASAQHANSASRSSFATEDPCPRQETWLRTAQHGLREPKSRQEKMETSSRQLPKKGVSKRHGLPLALHDSLGSVVNLSVVGKGSDRFPVAELEQCSYVYELSPQPWNFQETEFASIPSLHHSQQDLHDFQPLDLGFRTTEARTASESQTSFDVLKSIWSPKVAGRGAKLPVTRALGYPCLTHQPPSSRELNSDHGQPKEFFQLYSIIPPQHCSLDRQNPEAWVPSRYPQHGNGLFSVRAKPRTHCQKASLEQGGRTSNSYQFWGLAEAPARMQGSRDKGCPPGSGNQTRSLERLLQMEGAQQLRVFQQLPMSYFPPSEALENRHLSPLYTLQGQLLGQPSPEPWAFPRMKLY